jgi:uncharacterized protein YutE (UPF0331/DUF86 family)
VTPDRISRRIVVDRLDWVASMTDDIRSLPLEDREAFFADRRNVWSAESCLRRGLEALFDLGRHILAKEFAQGTSEYKEIARRLGDQGVLSAEESALLGQMGGYRNRLVHFYHEVEERELYDICVSRLSDVDALASALREWLLDHPHLMDNEL